MRTVSKENLGDASLGFYERLHYTLPFGSAP
jgi:hypothetical protein